MNPFEQLDAMYERFFGEITPVIRFLIRAFVLLLIGIVGGALLFGIGVFAL